MFLCQHRTAVVLSVLVATLVPLHARTVSRQSAEQFSKKLTLIQTRGDQQGTSAPQRTALTEDEVNSWFLYRGDRWRNAVPAGVRQPKVTLVGEGRLQAEATVDLDTVGRRRSGRGALDPLSLIGGTVPVTVSGVLHTRDGMGRFEVESAEVSGIPVPATVLQELVGYYSRSAERPEGIRLDETYQLPARIQRVELGRGQAVVVQ
jgi:hypothetical protein